MCKENGIILYGAGEFGRRALNFYGQRHVKSFVDTYKAGTTFMNKSVITFEELLDIYQEYDVIVSTATNNSDEIVDKLNENHIPFHLYVEDYNRYILGARDSNERIAKWRNAFSGKKCVLLGNGPSLSIQDLEKLHQKHVVTFGCNFINKIYDKTAWRPDFYCCIETSAILTNIDYIIHGDVQAKFVKDLSSTEYENRLSESMSDNLCLFNYAYSSEEFSSDPSKLVFDGYTVMFSMLEFAVYLGFSNIYLLGVDNSQPPEVHTSNFLDEKIHFYDEDESELKLRKEIMTIHKDYDNYELYEKNLNKYYGIAKKYTERHDIKIMNATRGGKLEVFERVDFDEVIANW
jgi:hypothetical protein